MWPVRGGINVFVEVRGSAVRVELGFYIPQLVVVYMFFDITTWSSRVART